jgi:hypothetical protein
VNAPLPPQLPPPLLRDRSLIRAWLALVMLSIRRLGRARMMVFVALGLLGIALVLVGGKTAQTGWSMGNLRYSYPAPKFAGFSLPRMKTKDGRDPMRVQVTYGMVGEQLDVIPSLAPWAPPEAAMLSAAAAGYRGTMKASGIVVYTRAMLFTMFLGFLLPVWCLSFATESLGGELESRSLVWLLTRPIPRWSIYLAKYLAILPWAMVFSLGGFWLMGRAAGPSGRIAFGMYWPAIALGTLAFTSLFHLIAATTRRPTVVGLVYCFFLETLLGDMPGLMKRVSVSYYVRCLIFDAAGGLGLQPDKPAVYQPVSGATATAVLIAITVGALILGMIRFSRAEYRDDAT